MPTPLAADLTGLPSWFADAACLGAPDKLGYDPWFPEGQGADAAEAAEVCRGCPVREPCLDYALEQGIRFGVWGGMSAQQREKIARRAG